MNGDNTPSQVRHDDLLKIRAKVFDGSYFDIDGDVLQFRDIVTHERLRPNQAPPAVATDPVLKEGLEYLRNRGGRREITVHLLLANHSKKQDFTQMLGNFPKAFASPLMGIEADWTPSQDGTRLLPHETNLHLAPSPTGRGAFQHAQVDWLRAHDKIILPCEIDETAARALPRTLARMWNIFEAANADRNLPPATRIPTCNLALFIYQSIRQWAILGQLGYWLSRLDRVGQLPSGDLTVPLMLGSWHAGSENRLKTLNVPVIAHKAPISPKDLHAEYGRIWMESLLTMRADAEFIRSPRPGQQ